MVQSPSDLGLFAVKLAFGKPRAGQLPIYSSAQQIQPFSISNPMDSEAIKIADQVSSITEFLSRATITWGLNTNPLFSLTLASSASMFEMFADFPGFSKNSAIGIQLQKPQFDGQSTPWIYGVTQYPSPFFDSDTRILKINGYGVLLEAIRRHNSRNFKTGGAKQIISTIAKRYGMGFDTRGEVPDVNLKEPEQNIDDFTFLNIVSAKLNSYWLIEENTLVLINADYMFNQTPKINFVFGQSGKFDQNNLFPISAFIPESTARSFEAGAARLTARGIDLDTGETTQQIFSPKRTCLGVLSLSSNQFRSDSGVTINTSILRPCPEFSNNTESEIFLPFHTRSDEDLLLQFMVESKNLTVRASLETVGLPTLKPGILVNVQGVGNLFGGNYAIETVEHIVEKDKGFTTVLRLMRNGLGQIQTATPFKSNLRQAPESASSGGIRVLAEAVPPV